MTDGGASSTARPVALVTGASRGIGAAIAQRLAADGLHVVLNYRENSEAASATLAKIKAAGGHGSLSPFDVTNAEETATAIEALLESCHVSVLVNNAGVIQDGLFPVMEEDAWQRVTRTTLDGFYNVTRPLLMPMVRARFGRVVNIASVSGLVGNRGQVNYSAAKAGIIGATKALALEVAARGVTVNAVAPGLIETDMLGAAPVTELLGHIPMKRLGRPEEVADLVGFLCSDRAAYITGQAIGITGGLG
jgi:3-oxoacyl-[acyl-carrier protein] reductase